MTLGYCEILKDVLKIIDSLKKQFHDFSLEPKEFTSKHSSIDLVTKYDSEIETLIKSRLIEHYPNFKFKGEETASLSHDLDDQPTWMVDPIDGTTNFIHNYPGYCVSIGLSYQKNPVVGVVYFPFNQDIFYAAKGSGAFLNGKPLKVSNKNYSNALILTNIGSSTKTDELSKKMHVLRKIISGDPTPHGIRMIGSAAQSLCLVASGVAEIYYERGIFCWDVCAGAVILEEAGGVILSGCDKEASFFDEKGDDEIRNYFFANNLQNLNRISEIADRYRN